MSARERHAFAVQARPAAGMIRQLGTRFLALVARASVCWNGPLQGEKLVLTEYSRSTAWVEVRGEVGRYVMQDGKLIWERRK